MQTKATMRCHLPLRGMTTMKNQKTTKVAKDMEKNEFLKIGYGNAMHTSVWKTILWHHKKNLCVCMWCVMWCTYVCMYVVYVCDVRMRVCLCAVILRSKRMHPISNRRKTHLPGDYVFPHIHISWLLKNFSISWHFHKQGKGWELLSLVLAQTYFFFNFSLYSDTFSSWKWTFRIIARLYTLGPSNHTAEWPLSRTGYGKVERCRQGTSMKHHEEVLQVEHRAWQLWLITFSHTRKFSEIFNVLIKIKARILSDIIDMPISFVIIISQCVCSSKHVVHCNYMHFFN